MSKPKTQRRIDLLVANRRFFYIRNPDYVGRATNRIPQGNTSSPLPLSRVFEPPDATVESGLFDTNRLKGLQNVSPYNFQF